VKKHLTPQPPKKPAPQKPVVGVCTHDGKRFYASRVPGEDVLTLCVPTDKGILIRTDSKIIPTGEVKFDPVADAMVEAGKVAPFECRPEFELGEKMVTVKNEEGVITDYQDVTVAGLASDFSYDRDGEHVVPGAFSKSLNGFRKNPVMLIDHVNSVKNIIGSYKHIREGDDGLQVSGLVSNAPDLKTIRFLIAEKHLKAFSIGGMMRFGKSDHTAIEEVELFEISVVAIPANGNTLFHSRMLDLDTAKKAFKLN